MSKIDMPEQMAAIRDGLIKFAASPQMQRAGVEIARGFERAVDAWRRQSQARPAIQKDAHRDTSQRL